MYDLRTATPVKSTDKITGKECFILPVNVIEISEIVKGYKVYKNSTGTKCRDIKINICKGDGNLTTLKAVNVGNNISKLCKNI
ncbi:hypothetical protein [Jejuia spongiicola]|uniref:Uncharacterized protein n=1 Tax=Jejuia spongiicola TaxID=2942207 RepID=A0ABT0QA84_9FLAO|nr:hypothetical protein [Jejuia spongiicola]MCL6293894.1 hypothetical protein [Jejuia spongiicola]